MKPVLSFSCKTASILALTIVCALAATDWGMDIGEAAAAAVTGGGNFRSFMMNVVAPATQPIWDLSYAEKVSDEDWGRLKKAAADLNASVKTVSSGGTIAAEQARAKDAAWQGWTKKMSDAAGAAKRAVDAKDQPALATAGDTLLEVCEGCHMAFDPTSK